MTSAPTPSTDPLQRFAAWSVHLFTATGAVLALLSLGAILGQRWTEAMLWLLLALVVDGVDGTLARKTQVKERLPRIDGDVLDLVIDYLTYVFVPTVFMWQAGLLPSAWALPLGALIQLSSLYVFARRDMKTEDGYFRGFPALWNVVALYLFAAQITPLVGAAVVSALALLSFAPVHVPHPFRARGYGSFPALLAGLWAASTAMLLALGVDEAPRQALLAVSAAAAALLILMGVRRSLAGPRAAT